MGDIEILVYDYCEARISRLSRLLHVSTIFLLKTDYKQVKLFLNVYKNGKIAMISDNYHDIGRLLLLNDYC